jgi:hypothetical protein
LLLLIDGVSGMSRADDTATEPVSKVLSDQAVHEVVCAVVHLYTYLIVCSLVSVAGVMMWCMNYDGVKLDKRYVCMAPMDHHY